MAGPLTVYSPNIVGLQISSVAQTWTQLVAPANSNGPNDPNNHMVVHSVILQAGQSNTGTIAVGGAQGSSTASLIMVAGQVLELFVSDPSYIYVQASASSQSLSALWY